MAISILLEIEHTTAIWELLLLFLLGVLIEVMTLNLPRPHQIIQIITVLIQVVIQIHLAQL